MDAIANLGGLFGGGGGGTTPTWMKILLGALTGTGEIGNILAGRERAKEADVLKQAQRRFANLTPEQLSSLVLRAERPLEAGLTQNVGNVVQASLAERGLSQAPGIFGATLSQALAPYELEQRRQALELVFKQLGLPIEYANAILQSLPKETNMAPLLALLLSSVRKPAATPPTFPTGPGDYPPSPDQPGFPGVSDLLTSGAPA